ncbi:MAG: methionine--tRNA ligase [Thermomicrobiales bacterium]
MTVTANTPPGQTPFYITTAIDYPNGAPHVGHSLEKVAADVVARYHRLLGHDTAYTMGLDENSQHILRAANENGVTPIVWTTQMDDAFRGAWDALNISRTTWVRTTEERHFRASTELFRRAQENGDVYTSTYAGWYCPNCNAYYTDEDLIDGRCPNHPTLTPEWLEEENYFFALSKYGERLRAHMEEHPEFITPAVWRPEMLALIDRGLRDFSVSRAVRPGTKPWGVPVPGDPDHVLYVWFDALTTYLTAIGFPDETFERYWPADSQVIGKDIQRFHCLYWPAMLLSAGLPLPRRVVVHGFITIEGKRISKTTGNVIYPPDLVAEFGADPVRYYLMRDFTFRSDGDFSRANLIRRHNDDLGNDLGNLLNRVVAMVGRYRSGQIPEPGEAGEPEADLRRVAEEARDRAAEQIEAWELDRALDSVWGLVRRTNQYLEARQPWKLAKQPEAAETLDTTLWTAAEATRLAAVFLAPYVPATSDKIVHQLGLEPVKAGAWANLGQWGAATFGSVNPAGPIFPRIEVIAD